MMFRWQSRARMCQERRTRRWVVDNVQPVHEGDYAVVVANAVGLITSDIAHLTVLLNPSCTSRRRPTRCAPAAQPTSR